MATKFCNSCGAVLNEQMKFCAECGAAVAEENVEITTKTDTVTEINMETVLKTGTTMEVENAPDEKSKYAPISTLGYIGIMLLICLPCIGFIFLIVWAFGGCRKVNKRNFARAALLLMAIMMVISLAATVLIKRTAVNMFENSGMSILLENTSEFSGQNVGQMDDTPVFTEDKDSEGNVAESSIDISEALGLLQTLSGTAEAGDVDIAAALEMVEAMGGEIEVSDIAAALELLEELGVEIEDISGYLEK